MNWRQVDPGHFGAGGRPGFPYSTISDSRCFQSGGIACSHDPQVTSPDSWGRLPHRLRVGHSKLFNDDLLPRHLVHRCKGKQGIEAPFFDGRLCEH